jgi:hypothetical protein
MKLMDDIIDAVVGEEREAEDVRVGLHYTAVRIENEVGLAYNFPEFRFIPRNVGNLAGTKLVRLARSWNLAEASIGVAAINAHLIQAIKHQYHKSAHLFERVTDLLRRAEYKKIGIVGCFKPLIDKLAALSSSMDGELEIYVFEKRPLYFWEMYSFKGVSLLPDNAEDEILPICDLVIVSGSAFVNKTLEHVLRLSGGYTIVAGATTPLSTVLFDYGADALAGIEISAPGKALSIVSEGGGRPHLEEVSKFIYLEKKRP